MKTIDWKVRAALPVLTAVQFDIDAISLWSGRGRCANRLGGKRFATLLVWLAAVAGIPGLFGTPAAAQQNLGTVALGSSPCGLYG